MPGRHRLTDAELAEIRRRRPGMRASLACEDMYLTAEDEALFEQMDKAPNPDERARRIIEVSRAARQRLLPPPDERPLSLSGTDVLRNRKISATRTSSRSLSARPHSTG